MPCAQSMETARKNFYIFFVLALLQKKSRGYWGTIILYLILPKVGSNGLLGRWVVCLAVRLGFSTVSCGLSGMSVINRFMSKLAIQMRS